MKQKNYKLKSKKLVARNKRFKVYFDNLDIDGKSINDFLMIRPIVQKKNNTVGVCVIPEQKRKYGLMKVWRHQFNQFLWQVPAGFVEKNETVKFTAIKELIEETGLKCEKKNLRYIGQMIPDAGLLQGKVFLYLALDCKKITNEITPEIGVDKICYFTKVKVKKMLKENKILSASSFIALTRALNYEI